MGVGVGVSRGAGFVETKQQEQTEQTKIVTCTGHEQSLSSFTNSLLVLLGLCKEGHQYCQWLVINQTHKYSTMRNVHVPHRVGTNVWSHQPTFKEHAQDPCGSSERCKCKSCGRQMPAQRIIKPPCPATRL